MGSTKKVVGVWNVGTKGETIDIPPKTSGTVRFVCLSDTHEDELELEVPNGDVLIHSGDFSYKGEGPKIAKFNNFLGSLPHQYKIVIAGNHDITFHEEFYEQTWQRFHRKKQDCKTIKASLTNCIYLEDSMVTVFGINIYGSPWQPYFANWAFNLPRGPPLQQVWAKIPAATDILVTHGPPFGHGDTTSDHKVCGDQDLLEMIKTIRPALHVCGHIHEGYGVTQEGPTVCVNAANNTLDYNTINRPIVVDVA